MHSANTFVFVLHHDPFGRPDRLCSSRLYMLGLRWICWLSLLVCRGERGMGEKINKEMSPARASADSCVVLHNNDIDSVAPPLWTCTLDATCRTVLRCVRVSRLRSLASWAPTEHNRRRGSSGPRAARSVLHLVFRMIAAAFLVLLRPYSVQCVLLLLLLLLGTIATILFLCCWHRRIRDGKHPIKSVLSGRTKSRGECGACSTHVMNPISCRHTLNLWLYLYWPQLYLVYRCILCDFATHTHLEFSTQYWLYYWICEIKIIPYNDDIVFLSFFIVVGLRSHHFRSEVGWTFCIICISRCVLQWQRKQREINTSNSAIILLWQEVRRSNAVFCGLWRSCRTILRMMCALRMCSRLIM